MKDNCWKISMEHSTFFPRFFLNPFLYQINDTIDDDVHGNNDKHKYLLGPQCCRWQKILTQSFWKTSALYLKVFTEICANKFKMISWFEGLKVWFMQVKARWNNLANPPLLIVVPIGRTVISHGDVKVEFCQKERKIESEIPATRDSISWSDKLQRRFRFNLLSLFLGAFKSKLA